MNQQTVNGNWNQVKGKITEKWGDVTDQELDQAQGNWQQLVGVIQEKTGETRQAVENYLNSVYETLPSMSEVVDTAKEYAAVANEKVQETARQTADQIKAGYIQSERLIRQRPLESVAVTFGIGVIAGLLTGLMMRSK